MTERQFKKLTKKYKDILSRHSLIAVLDWNNVLSRVVIAFHEEGSLKSVWSTWDYKRAEHWLKNGCNRNALRNYGG